MIEFFNNNSILLTIGVPLFILLGILYIKTKSKFPIFSPIILLIIFTSIMLTAWFFKDTFSDKALSLLASLIVGLFTLLISIIINYTQLKSIDLFKTLKVKDILKSRSDPDYYRPIINRANDELWVLGVTANRLLEDFCDPDSPEKNKKILIKKIEKGLKVKLLLPKKTRKYLPTNEDYRKHDSTMDKLKALDIEIKKNIDIKLYNKTPAHSIFYTENECIVGPIFQDVPSKHTPAIHFDANSLYTKEYLKFFNKVWEQAEREKIL